MSFKNKQNKMTTHWLNLPFSLCMTKSPQLPQKGYWNTTNIRFKSHILLGSATSPSTGGATAVSCQDDFWHPKTTRVFTLSAVLFMAPPDRRRPLAPPRPLLVAIQREVKKYKGGNYKLINLHLHTIMIFLCASNLRSNCTRYKLKRKG